MRCDGVSQTAGLINAGDRRQNFGWNLFVQFDVLVKLLHQCAAQRLDLSLVIFDAFICNRDGQQRCSEVLFAVYDAFNMRALKALDQHLHRAIGQFEHLQNAGHTAHLEHVAGTGFIFGGSLLGHQHDAAIRRHRGL